MSAASAPTAEESMVTPRATSVSVVIPTLRRPAQVVRAVRSAVAQTFAPLEVLVVVDGPDNETVAALQDIEDPKVRVIELADNGGPGRARNVGVAAATGDWIAFLDDDDEWKPSKLEAQLSRAGDQSSGPLVISCTVSIQTGTREYRWPKRGPRPGEPIAEYLFVRRQAGEGYLATPTILLPRSLALACPFPVHWRTHEDWDWLLDLDEAGARFVVVPGPPLVTVYDSPHRVSVSRSSEWSDSLSWALRRRSSMTPRAFSAFLLTEVARSLAGPRSARTRVALLALASTGDIDARTAGRFAVGAMLPGGARQWLAAKRERS